MSIPTMDEQRKAELAAELRSHFDLPDISDDEILDFSQGTLARSLFELRLARRQLITTLSEQVFGSKLIAYSVFVLFVGGIALLLGNLAALLF